MSSPHLKKTILARLGAVLFVATAVSSAQAATKTWSCTNDYWYTSSCWNLAGVPISTDDVVVGPVSSSNTSLTFDSTTGTRSVNSLLIDSTTANTINFVQSGGSLTVTDSETIGSTGIGTFTQNGGAHAVNVYLYLGYNSSSSGSYDLSGTGSLWAASEIIGNSGTGVFKQSGGTNTVRYDLILGNNSGSSGSYDLSGTGSLTVDREIIGHYGTGGFIQSGGTHTVSSLLLGTWGGSGNYTMYSGSLTAAGETIGQYGTGTFTQSGGTHSVGSLYLGFRGSNGSYDLSGTGSLSASSEFIGNYGAGSFIQSGGTHTVGYLFLGAFSGGSGSYTLSTGELMATLESIGREGVGSFVQNGGTHTANSLYLGDGFGSNGSYILNSGSLTVTNIEYIAFFGTGTFTQSGGTHTVNGNLVLGYYSGSIGSSIGTYNLSGGTHTVDGNLVLGYYSGSSGTYNLNGGTLDVANNIVNYAGTSTINMDGGTLILTSGATSIAVDNFNVGNVVGSNGSFTLAAGQSLTATNMNIAAGGTGSFAQNGGTLTVANGITNNLNGTFNLGAGAVATVGGSGFVNHGLLKGKGTIAGNVTSDGTVGPGNSPGVLTINGNYAQFPSGILNIEIGGLLAGTEYDVLNISGTASLAGTLNVSLFDLGSGLFNPNAGDTFDILTAETITGTFDILSFANLINPNLSWHVDYLIDAIGTTDVVRLSFAASAVPIPAAVWLFGSGLLGLIGAAKRRTRK